MKKSTLYGWLLALIMIAIFILTAVSVSQETSCGIIEGMKDEVGDGVILGMPAGLNPDTSIIKNGSATNFRFNVLGYVQLLFRGCFIGFLINYIFWARCLKNAEVDEEYFVEKRDIARTLFWVSLILGWILAEMCGVLVSIDKPIIYLYPEQTQEVSVKLGNEELVTVSYPKYEDSWEVSAEPNGDLTDLETGRKLYALYYESNALTRFKVEDEGFVIKGEDSAEFLEEKLEILGLNYKEAEEFIVYWLPKLEANKYNYIRFATREEIEKNMPLEISGEPDSVIRVIMTYKGLRKPIEVKEQKLTTPSREGFVVVEWGGTEIK